MSVETNNRDKQLLYSLYYVFPHQCPHITLPISSEPPSITRLGLLPRPTANPVEIYDVTRFRIDPDDRQHFPPAAPAR